MAGDTVGANWHRERRNGKGESVFVVGKMVEMLLSPLDLALVALLLALALMWRGRVRAGRRLLAATVAALLALAVPPWSDWLLRPLENRFPEYRESPARVDGIVVLGGSVDPVRSQERGRPVLGGAAERITALVELARRHPEAKVVFTGGSGDFRRQDVKEAHYAAQLLARLGVADGRVLYEDQSRNTRENALFAKPLAMPGAGESWLLVTSAAHMPRAVGAFRAAGWSVVPYPVDHRTGLGSAGWGFRLGANAAALRAALHEWAGLAYYRLRGWSDSLYPAP